MRKKVLKKKPIAKPKVETSDTKRILLAKKSLLGSRIISKMLVNLELDYDKISDISKLESEVMTGKYDLLLTDNDLLPADVSPIEEKVDIIVLPDSTVTKESLNSMINKYRG